MAFDLQIVQAQSYVPLKSIGRVEGSEPPMVTIQGGPFEAVEAVLINGVEAPSFMIENSGLILAEIPSSVLGGPIDVEVLSPMLFLEDQALYRFRLGEQPQLVTGIPRLLQMFVRMLLQTPGSSLYLPDVGGGLLSLMRSAATPTDATALISVVHLGVQKCTAEVMGIQARTPGLRKEERLASADLKGCGLRGDRIYVDIDLRNQTGQKVKAGLQF